MPGAFSRVGPVAKRTIIVFMILGRINIDKLTTGCRSLDPCEDQYKGTGLHQEKM